MRREAVGQLVLFTATIRWLLNIFFIFPALQLHERQSSEAALRMSALQGQVVAVLGEIAWTALHPHAVSSRAAALGALCSAAAIVASVATAFGALDAPEELLLPLQCVNVLAFVPAAQWGALSTLSTGLSPARYKITAWLVVMGFGTAQLALPPMAFPAAAVTILAALPTLSVALALWQMEDAAASPTASLDKAARAPPVERCRQREALIFVGFACGTGTLGEAINDMACDLRLRDALASGDRALGLAYNAAVMVAMCAAMITETRPRAGGKGASHAPSPSARIRLMALWAGNQLFRGAFLVYLTQERLWLMMLFVLSDKCAAEAGEERERGDAALVMRPRPGTSDAIAVRHPPRPCA